MKPPEMPLSIGVLAPTFADNVGCPESRARSIVARWTGSVHISKPSDSRLSPSIGSRKTIGEYSGRSPRGDTLRRPILLSRLIARAVAPRSRRATRCEKPMPSSPGYRSGSWRLETNARNSAGLVSMLEATPLLRGSPRDSRSAPLDLLARSLDAVQECDACSPINGERHVERNCERQEQPDQQQGVGHRIAAAKAVGGRSGPCGSSRQASGGSRPACGSNWTSRRASQARCGAESGRYPRNLIPLATTELQICR